jgi:GNAT superfamily N-acetyltransferase
MSDAGGRPPDASDHRHCWAAGRLPGRIGCSDHHDSIACEPGLMNLRLAQALAIRREDLRSNTAQRLIEALNSELSTLYPEPGANPFGLDPVEVTAEKGVFLVGYFAREPVACGAIRCIDARVAEIKRRYVAPGARGRGFSRFILAALQDSAVQLGMRRLVLETGPRQLPALALYRRAGFESIPRFGAYTDSELSFCMGKDLPPRVQISNRPQHRSDAARDQRARRKVRLTRYRPRARCSPSFNASAP